MNLKAIELIKVSEGWRAKAYQDVGGVWTIGYGHTGPDVHEGMEISRDEGDVLLAADYNEALTAVQHLVSVPLNEDEQGALIDFVFNLGERAFSTSTLRKLLNQGKYEEARQQLKRWNHDNGMVIAGLTTRRKREMDLWATGEWT